MFFCLPSRAAGKAGGEPETRMSTTTGGRSNVPIHDLTVLISDKLSYLSPPLLNLTTNRGKSIQLHLATSYNCFFFPFNK